jgi:FAD synthetase
MPTSNRQRVLVFGTFDLFHAGHLAFLRQAAALGDELFVVVALDETVEKLKGQKPYDNQAVRLQQLAALPIVRKAVLGRPGDKYAIIEEIHPNIIALGYDQSAFVDQLQSELTKRGITASIVRLKAHHPEHYKTSLLRQRLEAAV